MIGHKNSVLSFTNSVSIRFIVYRNFLDTYWLIGFGIITLFVKININLNKHDGAVIVGFVSIKHFKQCWLIKTKTCQKEGNEHKTNQLATWKMETKSNVKLRTAIEWIRFPFDYLKLFKLKKGNYVHFIVTNWLQ